MVRPGPPERVSDESWAEYLFYRENRRGLVHERWWHGGGCRQWLIVERDTATQEIHATYAFGEAPPSEPSR